MTISDVDVEAVSHADLVVAIMGPTGSGKSNLIDTLMEQKGTGDQRSGNPLRSCTDKVQAARLPPALAERHLPGTAKRVVLVDTPGFDDTNKTDMDILNMIGAWLAKTYKNHVKLAGIIFLHRSQTIACLARRSRTSACLASCTETLPRAASYSCHRCGTKLPGSRAKEGDGTEG
ncbi:hypothetical protein JAAARDRAFT_442684 [Jaapia argillacea MUCL 33604]|uniref:G domain-containing protein n=1 Tax=Jaapia argillacea MUCL 33604 TaxID=933084 RepID=A0A067PDN9_9AGAM|nr:hypothetical protein JAAARDRAFT_442684 [Jaapia argillacea MUCL 33604]